MGPNCQQAHQTRAKIFRPWDQAEPTKDKTELRVPPVDWESVCQYGWTEEGDYWAAAAALAAELAAVSATATTAPSANQLSLKAKQRPKKFRCPHCDVAFSNNGQLKGHVRIHTGERPYKCDAEGCGKCFTRNEELTRHKRIHSGLRPYPCQECGKSFGRKDHLKKHARTHLPQHQQVIPYHLIYPYLYGY